jgi:hypothetical protein
VSRAPSRPYIVTQGRTGFDVICTAHTVTEGVSFIEAKALAEALNKAKAS